MLLVAALCVAAMMPARAAAAQDQGQDKAVEVIVYPILIQAPVFGASIKIGNDSGETEVSVNTLYMMGVAVYGHRFALDVRGQWASLSATAQAPLVAVDTAARFFTARGGVTVGSGFTVEAGLRRIWGELDASLTVPNANNTVLTASTDKAFYDPLVGIDWRRRSGKFIFEGNFLGGGFGVGTDADVSGEFDVNWRLARHFDLRLGYGFFYYKITSDPIRIGSSQQTFSSSQTLHGPALGFGIVF
jgi:hypothetical protein